jgi:predicted membrane-bound mannosyltransferase
MNNQYEHAIEQSGARLEKCKRGEITCRQKAIFWRQKWIISAIMAGAAAITFAVIAAYSSAVMLLFAGGCGVLCVIAAIEAPKSFHDFHKYADEWRKMANDERDYLSSLQGAQREWRGY